MRKVDYYILDAAVRNPKPDRRCVDSWDALPEFPRDIYKVSSEDWMRNRIDRVAAHSRACYGTLFAGDPGFGDLVAALRPAPWLLATALDRTSFGAEDVLRLLLETGMIAGHQVDVAIDWLEAIGEDDRWYDPTTDQRGR